MGFLKIRAFSLLSIFVLFLCHTYVYPREPDSSSTKYQQTFHNFTISNSIGYNFDKSKPAFYFDFLKNLSSKLSIGFRIGLFAYHENIQDEFYDMYKSTFESLRPGYYQFVLDTMRIDGLTNVFTFNARYKILKWISVNLYIGAKQLRSNFYKGVFFYQKSDLAALNYYSVGEITPVRESKNIIKAYYAAGVNYHLGWFEFGVYGDNIYSLGINLGISF